MTELKEAIESIQEHKVLKIQQEVSKDISSAHKHQRKMPENFIHLGENVEAIWSMLMQQDASVVGLVGMGGIGTQMQLL